MASLQEILSLTRSYNKSDSSNFISWQKSGSNRVIIADDGEIQLPNATATGQGILIGGDVELYRSAADELMLPDDIVLDNTGASVNSRIISLRGDNAGNEIEAQIQLMYGADPYIVIKVDDDGTTPALTDALYIKDNRISFPTGNAITTNTSAGNTLLLQAYDVNGGTFTTFGTFTANDEPSFELDNTILDTAIAKGTWTASGTWTIPAVTLGGTISGGSQDITALKHIGLSGTAVSADDALIANETFNNSVSAKRMIAVTMTLTGTNGDNTFSALDAYSIENCSASAPTVWAARLVVSKTGATNNTGLIAGLRIGAYHNAAGGTVSTIRGIDIADWGSNVAGGIVTTASAAYIRTPIVAQALAVVNAYGLYIEAITGASTLNYAIYSLGGLNYLTGGVQELMTPSINADTQTVNSAPSANTITAVNTKSFVGTAQHIVIPAITPAANGTGITLTGLAISQGAIGDVADSENITIKQLLISGAAGQINPTGAYAWTGIDLTTPTQGANAAANIGIGIKITGGIVAGGAGAYQRGIDIIMNANTDAGLVIQTGKASIGTVPYATQPANSLGIAGGIMIGANSTNNLLDDASNGAGSAALYIGNQSILVSNGINFGPGAVTSITVVNGQVTAIS